MFDFKCVVILVFIILHVSTFNPVSHWPWIFYSTKVYQALIASKKAWLILLQYFVLEWFTSLVSKLMFYLLTHD